MDVPLTVELRSKDRDPRSKSLKCMNTFRVLKQKLHVRCTIIIIMFVMLSTRNRYHDYGKLIIAIIVIYFQSITFESFTRDYNKA